MAAASVPLVSPAPRLRSNFFWTLSGNIALAAAQWAVIVLLARLADPVSVGQYTLGLAIVSPIFTLASLNLRGLQATDISSQFHFSDYLAIRLVAAAAAFAATLAVLACGHYSQATALVVLSVALARALESTSEVCYGHWQQREQMDHIAKSMMLRGAASVAALFLVLSWKPSALWAAVALVAVAAVMLVGFDFVMLDSAARLGRATLPRWRSRIAQLAELGRVAGPLGLAPMLVTLNAQQPRYWLAHHRSETDVGVYSALAYITVAANVIVMALAQAAGPSMTRALDSGDRRAFFHQAARLALAAFALGAAGILAAWLWGERLMELCYGPGFTGHGSALLWLMTAGAFSYLASCAGYTLTAARRFLVQIPVLALSSAVIAAACWLLVPRLGVAGAAIAQAAGSALQFLVLAALTLFILTPGMSRGNHSPLT